MRTHTISASQQKLSELVQESSTCLYTHPFSKRPVPSCPTGPSVMTSDGFIWFFLGIPEQAPGDHAPHRAQLFYANSNSMDYLSITGEGTIMDPDSPECATAVGLLGSASPQHAGSGSRELLIRVHPNRAYYWNTRSGKLQSLLEQDQPASVY